MRAAASAAVREVTAGVIAGEVVVVTVAAVAVVTAGKAAVDPAGVALTRP